MTSPHKMARPGLASSTELCATLILLSLLTTPSVASLSSHCSDLLTSALTPSPSHHKVNLTAPVYQLQLTHYKGNHSSAGFREYRVEIRAKMRMVGFSEASISVTSSGDCGIGFFRNAKGGYWDKDQKSCPVLRFDRKHQHSTWTELPPVTWTPPACGCVQFRALVVEAGSLAYTDDKEESNGHLTRTVCVRRQDRARQIEALCSAHSRHSAREIVSRKSFQRRRHNVTQEEDRERMVAKLAARQAEVATCCVEKGNKRRACLDRRHRHRIDSFCADGEDQLTRLRYDHMREKGKQCCFIMGANLYHCFKKDVEIPASVDNNLQDISLDETDPVNDLADFLAPQDRDVINSLSDLDFNAQLDASAQVKAGALISARPQHKTEDTATHWDPKQRLPPDTKPRSLTNSKPRSLTNSKPRSLTNSKPRSEVTARRAPVPPMDEYDPVEEEEGAPTSSLESMEQRLRIMREKTRCCRKGQRFSNRQTAAGVAELGKLCLKQVERLKQDGRFSSLECRGAYVGCCMDQPDWSPQALTSSRRRDLNDGAAYGRTDSLPAANQDEQGAGLNLDGDNEVDKSDVESERNFQSMRASKRVGASEEEDEEDEEDEMDGIARFDAVDNGILPDDDVTRRARSRAAAESDERKDHDERDMVDGRQDDDDDDDDDNVDEEGDEEDSNDEDDNEGDSEDGGSVAVKGRASRRRAPSRRESRVSETHTPTRRRHSQSSRHLRRSWGRKSGQTRMSKARRRHSRGGNSRRRRNRNRSRTSKRGRGRQSRRRARPRGSYRAALIGSRVRAVDSKELQRGAPIPGRYPTALDSREMARAHTNQHHYRSHVSKASRRSRRERRRHSKTSRRSSKRSLARNVSKRRRDSRKARRTHHQYSSLQQEVRRNQKADAERAEEEDRLEKSESELSEIQKQMALEKAKEEERVKEAEAELQKAEEDIKVARAELERDTIEAQRDRETLQRKVDEEMTEIRRAQDELHSGSTHTQEQRKGGRSELDKEEGDLQRGRAGTGKEDLDLRRGNRERSQEMGLDLRRGNRERSQEMGLDLRRGNRERSQEMDLDLRRGNRERSQEMDLDLRRGNRERSQEMDLDSRRGNRERSQEMTRHGNDNKFLPRGFQETEPMGRVRNVRNREEVPQADSPWYLHRLERRITRGENPPTRD